MESDGSQSYTCDFHPLRRNVDLMETRKLSDSNEKNLKYCYVVT